VLTRQMCCSTLFWKLRDTKPNCLIEVLSPSTAIVDLNEKFDEYTQIESLQEYIIIAQDETKVRRFLRQDAGDWLLTQVKGLNAVLELPSIKCKLAPQDIYGHLSLTDPLDDSA
jgi:Uma2 family endonuclease